MHVDKYLWTDLWTSHFGKLMADCGSAFIPGPPLGMVSHHSQTERLVVRANRAIQDPVAKILRGSEHKWSAYLKPIVQDYPHTEHISKGTVHHDARLGAHPLVLNCGDLS